MEDEVNQVAAAILSNEPKSKGELLEIKKTLASYLKREKVIKQKFLHKKKSIAIPMRTHSTFLTSIPFLKERVGQLERQLVEFNKSLIMTIGAGKLVEYEEEDYKNMIVIVAGSKSRFTGETISSKMHLSKGMKQAFLSPLTLESSLSLLDEYLEYCQRLDLVDKQIIGVYSSQGNFLTNNDLSFLLVTPSTRESLSNYMKMLNLKLKAY